jgi:signal transduction histidine kinase
MRRLNLMKDEKIHLLVVDDDSFVRDMLSMILESDGYAVDTAENGIEALEKYAHNPGTNLIISDMNMPGKSGLELIRDLRARQEDVPIIILTGNNEIAVAVEAMNNGASDYLLKDENIQETILMSVNKGLEKYNLKKRNSQLMADIAAKNEELEVTNQELLELNKLKNKFLGMAAHDLRNPLSSIRGLSEILLGGAFGNLTDDQKEYLSIIKTTSDDMLTLLNELLDVSIIESGKLCLQVKKGSLEKLLADRIRIGRVIAEEKGIAIQSHFSEMPEVPYDTNRLAQVVDNLLSNAIKFSLAGTKVYISLEKEGEHAAVSIRDEGPGIPPEEQAKLFGEFQRLSVQPTGGERSTGLGLAIVKKVIEAHGGTVEVKSIVGTGSTFVFKLPLEEKVDRRESAEAHNPL